ncbi:unnamed protein product [Orchesella dallaii]|uniref:Protein kinase domain-containing protein n=1 Tax=Orchesella dallaii TaxID=48710 RepID=A0ABP1RC08_9HEXA
MERLFSSEVEKTLRMIQNNMIWKVISLLLVFNGVRKVECQGGIVFEPFVRNADDPDYSNTYKKNDVKVMLELISQNKFHYVSTLSVGAPNEPFKPNSTIQRCSSNVHAAVAAAELNKSKQRHLLSIYQGLFLSYMKQLETEIEVAFEVAALANKIYERTVPALVLTQSSFWQISDRPEIVKNIFERAQTSGLQLGARISDCEGSVPGLDSHHQKTLRLFHFIICERTPINVTTILQGPQLFKEGIAADIMKVENAIQGMGIETKVILETGWPGEIHLGELATVSDMFHFWKLIEEWARSGKRMVFMNEAFDNPWRDLKTVEKIENSVAIPRTLSVWGGHYGLWKHLETRDNSRNAYVPKVENSGPNGSGGDAIGRDLGGGGGGAVACADAGNGVNACAGAGGGDSAVATATAHFNSGNESKGNAGVIIGSVLGSVVLMLIILIALLSRRVKKLKKRSLSKIEIQQFLDGSLSNQENVESGETFWARGAYNRELELEKHSFSIDKAVPLGSGAFGSVYKGRICNSGSEYEVAFKTTRPACPAFALRGLLSEIKILSHLGKHDNIVSICGAYTAELDKGVAYVATELCSNGSLEKFLRVNRANDFNYVTSENQASSPVVLNELQLFRWTLEIAEGMEYISSKNVIHADLAARNVLLTDGLTAKITDFGLSRRLYEYTEYVKQKQEPLPWRWMAVESLKRLEFSTKSDVWAYGITLWEIWSLGDIPYPGRSWDPDFVLELENGLRNTKPSGASCDIYDIMVSCWNLNPTRRPPFEDIKLELKSAMEFMKANNSRNSVEYIQLVEMDVNNAD